MKKLSLYSTLSSDKLRFTVLYSITWVACAILLSAIFLFCGKTFIWSPDGLHQHYTSFNYLCDYIGTAFSQNSMPAFNFTLGQGADILTTLNSYDFTDPISIVMALLFSQNRVLGYTLMIFAKLYLIGFSFGVYCFATERKNPLTVLTGSLIYTFSGAVLYMVARHPNYINWAFFLPFLLTGVEIYLRKGKKLPLVLFVLWNVITSYYTFYMNVILVAIYIIVHLAANVIRNKSFASFITELKKGFCIVGVCSIGILLSMCVLLPTLHAYLINARMMEVSGYTASMWVYPFEYYTQSIQKFFASFTSAGYTSHTGVGLIAFIPLCLLFTKRKQHTELKVLLAICAFIFCVPLAGRIMNGFGYATNRWAYALVFYVSLTFVVMAEDIASMTHKEKKIVGIALAGYIILCVFFNITTYKVTWALIFVLATVLITIAVVSVRPGLFHQTMLYLAIFGAFYQICFMFLPFWGGYVKQFVSEKDLNTKLYNYSSISAANLSDDFYRVEKRDRGVNTESFYPVNPTNLWWSMIPSYVYDFHSDLALNTMNQNCYILGLDGRAGLMELGSVKYYTRKATTHGIIPYGYTEIPSPDARYQVFENQYALPIGYTYKNYIPSEKYAALNGVEKEFSMLQGAVLDNPPPNFAPCDINIPFTYPEYTLTSTQNTTIENNMIIVSASGGSFTLSSTVPEDYEIYLYLKGIELIGPCDNVNLTATRTTDECDLSKTVRISNLNYSWPVIRDDVAFNLGSGYSGENTFTVKFDAPSAFRFTDIQIIAVPMADYAVYASSMGEYTLSDCKISPDSVTGTISVPENRILQFSIPYSIGWKAYIDGNETEIMKSNVMYMAICLPEGNHKIELKYTTPYLYAGIVISLVTLICWIAFEIIKKRCNNEQ